jgi:hypothetical protein
MILPGKKPIRALLCLDGLRIAEANDSIKDLHIPLSTISGTCRDMTYTSLASLHFERFPPL